MYWTSRKSILTPEKKRERGHYLLQNTIKDDDGCMIWQGYIHKKYGVATVFNWTDVVHRHIFRLLKGKVNKGMSVTHLCNKFLCIHPDHLVLKTKIEMISYMARHSVNARRKKAHAKNQTKAESRTRKEEKDIRPSCQKQGAQLAEAHCQSDL